MAKLIKNNYRTITGDIKVNCYKVNIPRKIIEESGMDPNKEIEIKIEKNKIIIEEKRDDLSD